MLVFRIPDVPEFIDLGSEPEEIILTSDRPATKDCSIPSKEIYMAPSDPANLQIVVTETSQDVSNGTTTNFLAEAL